MGCWNCHVFVVIFRTLVSLFVHVSIIADTVEAAHGGQLELSTVTLCYDSDSWLLVDPVMLSGLPALNFPWLEPQGNLLLCTLDAIGTVADVATDVNGIVTTNGTRGRGKRVGGTKDGLDVD